MRISLLAILFAYVVCAEIPDSRVFLASRFGGSGFDEAQAMARDAQGNVYLAGQTSSADFPLKNALQGQLRGNVDGFLVKLSPSGELLFSTYFGGSGADAILGLAADADGNAYVTGSTQSDDFPAVRAMQIARKTAFETAFLAKIDTNAAKIVYSTYFGGGQFDRGYGVGLDAGGNAYIAGMTGSTDMPTRDALYLNFLGGYQDAFVAKFDPQGRLLRSTYLGGSGAEWATAIAVTPAGVACITGSTRSADYPTVKAYRWNLWGDSDAFVSCLDPSGQALVFSTYFGGEAMEDSQALTVDASGNVYIGGSTGSVELPVSAGASHLTAAPLYVSSDGGESFRRFTDIPVRSFQWLQFDPGVANRVWAVTSRGFLRSDDAGDSWAPVYSGVVSAAGLDARDPNHLFVIAEGPKLMESRDGGASWSTLTEFTFSRFGFNVSHLAVSPVDARMLYAWGQRLWRSGDGGSNWTELDASQISSVVPDARDASVAYAGTNYFFTSPGIVQTGKLLKIRGTAVTVLDEFLVNYTMEAATANGSLYASNYRGLLKSTDGGASWAVIGPHLSHVASGAGVLYAADTQERALYRSPDGGVSWERLDVDLHSVAVQQIAASPTDPQRVLLGANIDQDSGFTAGFSASGDLLFSTYSGNAGDRITALVIDDSGRLIAGGTTGSLSGLAVSSFVNVLDPVNGSATFSAVLPGSSPNRLHAIAAGPNGRIYAAGGTDSADFPSTNAPFPIPLGTHSAFIWGIAP